MSPVFREEEEEDNLFDTVTSLADRMGLKGEKRETYIDDHMIQGGYGRVQTRDSYVKLKPEENDDGGNSRWGFGGRRSGGGGGGGRSRRDDDDDKY